MQCSLDNDKAYYHKLDKMATLTPQLCKLIPETS